MLLSVVVVAAALSVPLRGDPDPRGIAELSRLTAVSSLDRLSAREIRLTLRDDGEVRLSDIERLLRTEVDRARLPLARTTILEIDAGQCFFCAEGPLAKRLAQRPFVERWSVVDYAARGRLRFRIEPKTPVTLAALRLPVEDVLLTDRYERVERVDLYWPTGGVLWRSGEAAARREATASKKPLVIFPTAGT